MPDIELFPISQSGGLKSISDDDLCATCVMCHYRPGGWSECVNEWPGLEDENGYVVQCPAYEEDEE